VRESVATIPPEQRVLVTAHDAFGYYGSSYGLEVASVQGLSTQAEASLADVRATADLVAERGVAALFVETSINPRTVQAVLEAVRERGGAAVIGGELYSDALGDPGTPGGTYIGMVIHNTEQIVTALGGAPLPLPEPLRD
jgi:manganese/zinc/iron transport system substrate-binding protein